MNNNKENQKFDCFLEKNQLNDQENHNLYYFLEQNQFKHPLALSPRQHNTSVMTLVGGISDIFEGLLCPFST